MIIYYFNKKVMDNKFKKIIKQCETFDEFDNKIKDLPNDEKGKYFEYFCHLYFLFDNKWKNLIKNSWLLNNKSSDKIKQQLGIPIKDNGIDIILETYDNKYFAVQCKYRQNKNKIIRWDELGTFLGLTFGISEKFNKGIFITNTINATSNIERSKKVIKILYHTLKKTSTNTFISINNNLTKEKKELITYKPREYQKDIINIANEYFKKNDKGRLYMPCGTGKTLVCHWIYKKLKLNNVCIAVPSLYLLSQVYNTWSEMVTNCKYLLIGSDAEIKEQNDTGLVLTTKICEIKLFLKKNKNEKIIIITTYQSSDRLCDILIKYNIKLNMCIYDEAHKTVGNSERSFSSLLNDKLKIEKRLFTTATEKIYKGNANNSTNEDELEDENNILSMDDEKIYGKIIHTYSLKKAIVDNQLCDYKIICPLINKQCFKKMIKKNNYIVDENLSKEEIEMRYYMCAYLVCRSIVDYKLKHILTFNNTNKNAKIFHDLLINFLKIMKIECKCYYLTGESNMRTRNKNINDFINDNVSIISSSRIFTEGVDIKEVDCVCFADNKISTIDIIQSIGRCLRKNEGKKLGYILLPSVVEFTEKNNEHNIFKEKDYFVTIKSVLKSLGTTDDRITDEFILNNRKKINGNLRKFVIKYEDIKIYSDVKIDFNKFENNFETIICNKWGIVEWGINLDKLKKYIDDHGERPKRNSEKIETKVLAKWLNHQTENYKNMAKIMKNKKIRKKWKDFINDDKYKKIFMSKKEKWYENLKKIKQYIIDNNGKRPSSEHVNPDIKRLGLWLSTQTQNYKNNEKSMKDNNIKNTWEQFINDKKYNKNFKNDNEIWDANLIAVKNYIHNKKTLPPAKNKDPEINRLGNWISNQKQKYNSTTGKKTMDIETKKKWKNFINDVKYKDLFRPKETKNLTNWKIKINEVKNFINKYKKYPSVYTPVSNDKVYELSLGNWVTHQRANYRAYKENDKTRMKIMSDGEIRGMWEQFINDKKYKHDLNKI